MLFSFALLRPDVGVDGKFGTLVRLLGVVWFPGVPGVRLPNLFSLVLVGKEVIHRSFPQCGELTCV